MADIEKVIEALHCRAYDDDFPCSICAYYRPDEKPVAKCDYRGLMDDAIALLKEQEEEIGNLKQTCQSMMEGVCLLKEQEAVKPVLDKKTGRIWLCGNCGSYVGFEDNDPHDPNEFDKYCRECGRPVLWEGR